MTGRAAKAIVAVAGFVTIVLYEIAQAILDTGADGAFTTEDIIVIAIAGLTAFGVWQKRNYGYHMPTKSSFDAGRRITRTGTARGDDQAITHGEAERDEQKE